MADTTLLQIVNNVQKELRLPQTGSAQFTTAAHSLLITSFVNKIIREFVCKGSLWDALKVYTNINTEAGTALLPLTLPDQTGTPDDSTPELDTISALYIPGSKPLVKKNDGFFLDYQRTHPLEHQPLIYRIRTKTPTTWTIEVCPTPDQVYQINEEIYRRHPILSAAADIPLVDPDVVLAGTLWWAKAQQGEDAGAEFNAFQMALSLASQEEGNMGDIETV